jgi:hypothetical protein
MTRPTHAYLFLKNLHLIGVVIFVGNILVTAWWKAMADAAARHCLSLNLRASGRHTQS